MSQLTLKNSPSYTIRDVAKQNQAFRKRVRRQAMKLEIENLRQYLEACESLLNKTESITVAMTERCRVKILQSVLNDKKDAL